MTRLHPKIIKYITDPFWSLKNKSPLWAYARRLERTQYYSRERLQEIQKERLAKLLAHTARTVPYYAELFKKSAFDPQRIARDMVEFRRLPFLTKTIIKQNTAALISNTFQKESLMSAKTGGSTGESLQLYIDFLCNQKRNATARRSDRWSGWDIGMPIAAVWGNPPKHDTVKKRLKNALFNPVFYLDTMALTAETMTDFANRIRSEKECALFGHAHSLFIFAQFCQNARITDLRPKGIIATSMMLLENERAVIEEVFHVKVTNRYGCEEVSLIGCECEEHNGMHLNIEHLLIEFIKPDGSHAAPGEEGEIVVTDLMNYGMPFIRYRLGDLGVPSERECPCGRGLPLMERVTGRTADFLKKKDGTQVAGISLIERTLTKIPGIQQMQIVQESLDEIVVNVVFEDRLREGTDGCDSDTMQPAATDPDSAQQPERLLIQELTDVFGDINIRINPVSAIQQESNGKYRFSICKV